MKAKRTNIIKWKYNSHRIRMYVYECLINAYLIVNNVWGTYSSKYPQSFLCTWSYVIDFFILMLICGFKSLVDKGYHAKDWERVGLALSQASNLTVMEVSSITLWLTSSLACMFMSDVVSATKYESKKFGSFDHVVIDDKLECNEEGMNPRREGIEAGSTSRVCGARSCQQAEGKKWARNRWSTTRANMLDPSGSQLPHYEGFCLNCYGLWAFKPFVLGHPNSS